MPSLFLKKYNAILDFIKGFYSVAFVIRFSLAMSLLVSVAILFSEQSLEALRVLAADDAEQRWPRLLFIVSAIFLSLMSWYCARVLLYLIDPLPGAPAWQQGSKKLWTRYLPRISGMVPLIAIAWALWRASNSPALEAQRHGTKLKVLALLSLLAAFILYIFFHLRLWLMGKLKGQAKSVQPPARQAAGEFRLPVTELARSSKIVLSLTIALWLGLLLIFTFQVGRLMAVKAAVGFGPLAIVMLIAGIWIPIGSTLVYGGKRSRLPLFTLLLIWAIVISVFDWNDNHKIRHQKLAQPIRPTEFNEGFKQWLSGRCDRDAYPDAYPVFIVSAEGGGIRAAYFTSLVLASMQDQNPAFAHHVFAISGVSGGSLGAAVFAGLADKYVAHDGSQPCQFGQTVTSGQTMRQRTDTVLGQDLLSPLLASGLFPDLLQRFLPLPINRFDRARAIEDALGQYWNAATGGNEFSDEFYFHDLWRQDFPGRSTPALFLNTTRVDTGERMVVSNLNPVDPDPVLNRRFNGLISLTRVDDHVTLPLSTAACLSARFPLVTPAGYLPITDEKGEYRGKIRYVDGGYFENSGTATLLDLISAMKIDEAASAAGKNLKIIIIRIGSDPAGQDSFKYKRQGLGEITSPIFTLLNTRNARGTLSTRQLETAISKFNDRQAAAAQQIAPALAPSNNRLVAAAVAHFQVVEREVKLPLGWLLSKEAREEMKKQLDEPQQCEQTTDANYCAFWRVLGEIKK